MKTPNQYVISSKKAQLKIQQMAFVLVALMILFSMVALVYLSISRANLIDQAKQKRDQEARELARKLSGAPELTFTSSSDCSSCIDFDKVLMLKDNNVYKDFWSLDYLMIKRISTDSVDIVCTRQNYPNCNNLVLVKENANYASATKSFVTLAHWEPSGRYYKYELGEIYVSVKGE
ncbi:MAG: hypothetical protein Q7S74_01030 [Nanoarchaeota archaeon]|nr:hypothetical protein [Nanoarchaeota archaeon]